MTSCSEGEYDAITETNSAKTLKAKQTVSALTPETTRTSGEGSASWTRFAKHTQDSANQADKQHEIGNEKTKM